MPRNITRIFVRQLETMEQSPCAKTVYLYFFFFFFIFFFFSFFFFVLVVFLLFHRHGFLGIWTIFLGGFLHRKKFVQHWHKVNQVRTNKTHNVINVTLRRVRKSFLSRKSNQYYTFVSVCARASSCISPGAWACACVYVQVALLISMQLVCTILWRILWLLWLHRIFRHYLINDAILGQMLLRVKCVFLFSLHLLSKTFLILRRI